MNGIANGRLFGITAMMPVGSQLARRLKGALRGASTQDASNINRHKVSEDMESPGEYLRRERELRRISLSKIFETTRVPLKSLEALEADDYDNLPHPTFVKGYIKAYCKALGVDENDAVLRYEIYLRENMADKIDANKGVLPKKLVIPDDERPSIFNLSKTARTYLIYAVAGVVLVVAGYLFFSGGSETGAPEQASVATQEEAAQALPQAPEGASAPPVQDEQQQKQPQAPVSSVPSATSTTTEVKVAVDDAGRRVPDKQAAAAPSGRHTLMVQAREVAWIKIRIDGKEAREVILKAGESVSWEADEAFSLLIGNAGGIDVTYDGAKLGPLGKSGESVSLRLPRPAKTAQPGEVKKEGAPGTAGAKKPAETGVQKPQPAQTEPAKTNGQ